MDPQYLLISFSFWQSLNGLFSLDEFLKIRRIYRTPSALSSYSVLLLITSSLDMIAAVVSLSLAVRYDQ